MKLILKIALPALLLAGCGERDTICACIESGNALNKQASEILEKGSTKERDAKLRELKADKEKKCAEFKTMDGPQMRERMKDCSE